MRTQIQLLVLATLVPLAHADQLALTSSKDNTLYEDLAGAVSNAKGENCFAGRTGAGGGGLIRRTLMAFDLSAVPAGSTITSVTLQLNCSQANAGNATIELHQVLADWGEGTSFAPPGAGSGSGAPSTPGDATWIHRFFPSTFWTTAGGDFNPTVSGSHVVSVAGSYTFPSQAGMVADLQFWLDHPSQNFGWCLVGDESTVMTTKRFDTRESPTPALRPLLTVDFTPPTSTYCTAKLNSLGCTPATGSTGAPSATATGGFVVTGMQVRNQTAGLLFYGTSGRAAIPFQGGTLCVKTPVKRTPVTNSGGSTLPAQDCTGVYSIDMNTFASGGLGGTPDPLLQVVGTIVNCQWWGRDQGFPAPNNTTLTDGLEYTVRP